MTTFLLLLTVIFGGPQQARPVEDDARVAAVWQVSEAMAAGMPDAMLVFEPHRKGTFVGLVFPDSVTECSVGAFWSKADREWSPVMWFC